MTLESEPTAATPCPSSVDNRPSAMSDYCKTFLPFAPASHSIVAPANRCHWDEDATRLACERANRWLDGPTSPRTQQALAASLDLGPFETAQRGLEIRETKAIVKDLDTPQDYLDLTLSDAAKIAQKQRLKDSLIMKYIYFSRDVRPPYVGTMSQVRTRHDMIRLGRRPFAKTHDEELDYDYDSEAEWEEPEEGEDLDSENEDDAESEHDAADIDEFLDDKDVDEASRAKRKILYSDMQPLSTGLCWEDAKGKLTQASFEHTIAPRQFRMELLCGMFQRIEIIWSSHTEFIQTLSTYLSTLSAHLTGQEYQQPHPRPQDGRQ